jgi:hypothetical protein
MWFADERTFAERHKEHKKSSELKCETSAVALLHSLSKQNGYCCTVQCRGFFDDGPCNCRLTFDRGSPFPALWWSTKCTCWDQGGPQKIKENMCTVLALKDWFAHQVQEWQPRVLPVGCPIVRGQKRKRIYLVFYLRFGELEAGPRTSEDKYIQVYRAFGEYRNGADQK